LSLAQGSR